jgi:hypothetical protein
VQQAVTEPCVFGQPPTKYPPGVEVLYSFNPKNPCWDFSMYQTSDRVLKRVEEDGSIPWRFGTVSVIKHLSSGDEWISLLVAWDAGGSNYLYPHQLIKIEEVNDPVKKSKEESLPDS